MSQSYLGLYGSSATFQKSPRLEWRNGQLVPTPLSPQRSALPEDVLSKVRTVGGTPQEGRAYLPRLEKVAERAQLSKRLFSAASHSHRHYGAGVVLEDGLEAVATNVEASRQSTVCDLRAAMSDAFNKTVAEHKGVPLSIVPQPPKVKTIFLANADLQGDAPVPCGDCQEWLNSSSAVTPDTKVVSLEQDPEQAQPMVRMRTVADMLPLHKGRPQPVRMTTQKSINKLPLQTSESAKAVMAQANRSLSPGLMRKMLREAQITYQQNEPGSSKSGLKTGACAKLGPWGKLHSAGRFDWSTRWTESPDLRAAAKAFEAEWQSKSTVSKLRALAGKLPQSLQAHLSPWLGKPYLQAMAYYGDDPGLPTISSLGRMARERGALETLVLTVENDVIQCRTIADFMPEMYKTRH